LLVQVHGVWSLQFLQHKLKGGPPKYDVEYMIVMTDEIL
jgi:hypothetical protein